MGMAILDHWDLWSSRNAGQRRQRGGKILDHWDLWSSRNSGHHRVRVQNILDHWDLWSSRNPVGRPVWGAWDFRSLGFVV